MDDVPMIRDMTEQCKGCLCYHFPDDINKDGLCESCAKKGVFVKTPNSEIDIDWSDLQ
jgi:hypothetical protein